MIALHCLYTDRLKDRPIHRQTNLQTDKGMNGRTDSGTFFPFFFLPFHRTPFLFSRNEVTLHEGVSAGRMDGRSLCNPFFFLAY